MFRFISVITLIASLFISPLVKADTPLERYNIIALKYNNLYPRFLGIANADIYCSLYIDMACADLLLRTCSPLLQHTYQLLTATPDNLMQAIATNQHYWTGFVSANSENSSLSPSILDLLNSTAMSVSDLTILFTETQGDLIPGRLVEANNDFIGKLLQVIEHILNQSESQWME